MERFCQFKGRTCKLGHAGIVGIQFIYLEQARMYNRETRQPNEAQADGDRGEVQVFHGKVFVCFLNEHLADLFQAQFDGWYGGDLQQYERYQYTRITGNIEEMYKPVSTHRLRVGGGPGTSRFDDDVWRCIAPSTARSKAFDPRWEELDRRLEESGSEYTKRVGGL